MADPMLDQIKFLQKAKIDREARKRAETMRGKVQTASSRLADLLKSGPAPGRGSGDQGFALNLPGGSSGFELGETPTQHQQTVKKAIIDLVAAQGDPQKLRELATAPTAKAPTAAGVEGRVLKKIEEGTPLTSGEQKVFDLLTAPTAKAPTAAGVEGRVLKKIEEGTPLTSGEQKVFDLRLKAEARPKSRISADTSYIPVAQDKFQLMSVPKGGGEVAPVLRNGKPIVLSEKQVLIAEGKKAQSLVNPYATKFLSKLGESEGKRITELKAKAIDSVASKHIIAEARSLLDQGIYTGTAANVRQNFDKLLQEANIFIGGRKAANTEAYASMMGLQVGKIIKQFGAGTGLSDADREYAERIVGGKVTLTGDAIRRLLDINERLADFTISEFNSQAERAKRDLEEKDYLRPIEVGGLPEGVTEDDIAETFGAEGAGGQGGDLSAEEQAELELLRKRFSP